MKLIIYKGFDKDFLNQISEPALLEGGVEKKLNVLEFDKKARKALDMALLSLEEDDDVWATYEEYSIIKNRVDDAIAEDGLKLEIFYNNKYPDYYPIGFDLTDDLAAEITRNLETDITEECSEECQRFLQVYNALFNIDGTYYGSFFNYEYDKGDKTIARAFYPSVLDISDDDTKGEFDLFINEDIETYLRDFTKIQTERPSIIGVKSTDGLVSKRIIQSLKAYCVANKIKLVKTRDEIEEDNAIKNVLFDIAARDIKIPNFSGFRTIKFYKNPDIDKETIEVSQASLIQEIIHQAERSYDDTRGHSFRDIFITASTGAGKSVIFQIPAVYLAKKYHKLTIIIEPVKALMQDQKEKLAKSGFTRAAALNSDLTFVEKENVIKNIKEGNIDLVYLSPETLLAYSIETIIGEREIGLLIVDEAHTVTTWGMGFRPDYWYLGGYINRLRNQIQTTIGKTRKTYHFPVCAFTATAINGGIDDSVSDTIISLYMENPIKYIGYVRRDDIGFDIKHCEDKRLHQTDYEAEKTKVMSARIDGWLKNGNKTIAYFPYASQAVDASRGVRSFAYITTDKRIGVYTGTNSDDMSQEAFAEKKREAFKKFRSGEQNIMYATKAFGMGVDIDDVEFVYHYAASGNLSDYVQEIGRAARKKGLNGLAITDYFYNDLTFMNRLFGMSQIRQYQIKKVLEGIYEAHKSKNYARSFLISPESFTYIFNDKKKGKEDPGINKLKTCLLMLEKDFYDKYNFKVLVSRPQSVFTKAFVVVQKENEKKVLESKYGECFKYIAKGRRQEKMKDGGLLSDDGDVFSIDLKKIWEDFYPNISFPQFKYWYFNAYSTSKDKVDIMPEIREHFAPRQKINMEARGELILSEIRDAIFEDFEYIADTLYSSFGSSYFTIEDFVKVIREKYGMTKARIIANSLFELVDPNGTCVKRRMSDNSSKSTFTLSNGNFKEYLRKPINKSALIHRINQVSEASFSGYMSLTNDEWSNVALKLLSIFDYASFEILGGEEPEIYIRLNDPNKVKNIVLGNVYYSNNYVTRAKQKHDRDVNILLRFFKDLNTDTERWDYIEEYFLGYDVLEGMKTEPTKTVAMSRSIDKEKSYPTNQFKKWKDLLLFFDESDHIVINQLAEAGIPIPEYLETSIKKSEWGDNVLMSWPSKDTLICQQDTSNEVMSIFAKKGWNAYRIYEIDMDKIKGELC